MKNSGTENRLFCDGYEQKYELWEVDLLGFKRILKLHSYFISTRLYIWWWLCRKDVSIFVHWINSMSWWKKFISSNLRCQRQWQENYSYSKRGLSVKIQGKNYFVSDGINILTENFYRNDKRLSKSSREISDFVKTSVEIISKSLLIAMVIQGMRVEFKPFTTHITQKNKIPTAREFMVVLKSFEEAEKWQKEKKTTNMIAFKTEKVTIKKIINWSAILFNQISGKFRRLELEEIKLQLM